MEQVIKKYVLYAIVIGLVSALLAYHYIYTGGENVHIAWIITSFLTDCARCKYLSRSRASLSNLLNYF